MTVLPINISNRLTPSVPLEFSFSSQLNATGIKFTTIFGHMASSPGSGIPYQVYQVINVGDPVAALAEVNALAGAGSQIGKMVVAFINANVLAGRSVFPAFRIVLLPFSETGFGPSQEAIDAVSFLRSDMFVSPYPSEDSTNKGLILGLAQLISGIDRDLQGQFGSFVSLASLASLSTQIAFAYNSPYLILTALPDSNTALVNVTAIPTLNSTILTSVSSTAGIYPGASLSGAGIQSGSIVLSITNNTITMSLPASATHVSEAVAVQNNVSQLPEIVASAAAAGMMQSQVPYNPLQGMILGGLIPPQISADWIAINPNGSSEAALVAGLSPLNIQPSGTVAYIRTRTSYTLNGLAPVTAYFDWQDLVALNDYREEIFLVTQNPPFNNNPGGTKASAANAALLNDEAIRVAQQFEDIGMFQGVQTLAPLFQVVASQTSRGRYDCYFPINVLPGLFVIAGNIQAQSVLGNFTL